MCARKTWATHYITSPGVYIIGLGKVSAQSWLLMAEPPTDASDPVNMSIGSHSGLLYKLTEAMMGESPSNWRENGECATAHVRCTTQDPEPCINNVDMKYPDDRGPPSDSYMSMLQEAIENGTVYPLSHYCSSLTA